ncbi:carbohydrate-binding domain-containing protein [Chitinophaga sancti]|uniref:Carbohydrate-binding domain-containing protein n=1 Tax=Chitinophaga sancti TaxID=1004 RepID=A0A1K1S237_9BACT|nr:carbohydrate-binding domain-containing protein [Chitinophaga sancti]WQD59716.1 carbohydrate-binding domain-containing protein [Chitinophaga sancti]WQG88153.1 carbohydrate-binding domain-containing protein [Chitinophaga sancti]SFW78135.1 protein of unknown function [Chitinophaga sancti]
MKLSYLPFCITLLGATLTLSTSCKKSSAEVPPDNNYSMVDSVFTSGTPEGSAATGADAADLVDNTTFTSTVTINFGSSVTINNPLDGKGVIITQNLGDITITSSVAGVQYELSGTTTDGSVKIYSNNDYKVNLNSVTITNSDGPALNLQSTKRAFIVLGAGTTSTLKDGAVYAASNEDQKGTLFAEGPVIFSGDGVLSVSGLYQHAICSDQRVRLRSGKLYADAVGDGIHTANFIADGGYAKVGNSANGIVVEGGAAIVNGGSLEVDIRKLGLTTLAVEGTDPYININGGSIYIRSTLGKGLQSAGDLTVNKGNVDAYVIYSSATADNPGVSAKKNIYINGGYVGCKGYYGLHTDGNLTITGGALIAYSYTSIASGIDCPSGTFKITGGNVLGAGKTTSVPDANSSTVNALVLGGSSKVMHVGRINNGKEIMTFQPDEFFYTVLYASSKVVTDAQCDLFRGGSVYGNVGSDTVVATYGNLGGLYKTGLYISDGRIADTSFKVSSRITMVGGLTK